MSEILSLFTFIFLAALPGRTTFLLIVLAAGGHTRRIFIGAGLAFLIQCLISVVIGQFLVHVPQNDVEIVAGLLFIFFAGKFWLESKKAIDLTEAQHVHSIKTVFAVVFAAEFGDVSQLAIVTSASRASSKTMVFFIAVSALWIITAIALILGNKLRNFIKPNFLQRIASVIFLILGFYLFGKGSLGFFPLDFWTHFS